MRKADPEVRDGIAAFAARDEDFAPRPPANEEKEEEEEEERGSVATKRSRRECPVPKPGGVLGEIMGFKSKSGDDSSSRRSNCDDDAASSGRSRHLKTDRRGDGDTGDGGGGV